MALTAAKLDQLHGVASASGYGAKFDGITDDTTSLNAAIADAENRRASVVIPDDDSLVTAVVNSTGVPFVGSGSIILPNGQKYNSYADGMDFVDGREYLYALHNKIKTTGQIEIVLFGDSTVAGNNGEAASYKAEALLSNAYYKRGGYCATITNSGVGGTMVDDMDASAALADNDVDAIIIKYGINDGAYAPAGDCVELFATNLRAQLDIIRAARTVSTLSVILLSPTSVCDSPNGRDEQWIEKANRVIARAARDYHCCYIDVYAPFRDSRNAVWMDDPYSDGRHIHPLDHMNAWIWGGIIPDTLFSSGIMAYSQRNANMFYSNASAVAALPASEPDDYSYGHSVHRATAAQGWPQDGALETIRTPDGIVRQTLYDYRAGDGYGFLMQRVADTAGNVWKRWSREETALSYQNSWADYGSFYKTGSYSVSSDGYVQVHGSIKDGTTTAGTVIATIPVGLRPSASLAFPCTSNAGIVVIYVNADGTITTGSGVGNTILSLDSIRYRAG